MGGGSPREFDGPMEQLALPGQLGVGFKALAGQLGAIQKALGVLTGFRNLSVRAVSVDTTGRVNIVQENPLRRYLLIRNTGAVDVFISQDETPGTTTALPLSATTGFIEFTLLNLYTGKLNGIVAAGTGTLIVAEG